ncbi:hypothetical protein [Streptomyces sp. NBC_00654]|uniref:hypothetical protein n=1 Tax=Streptomyces sp. NBC_00654 TaxID=2975799 RepID=UPI00338D637E
MVDRSLWQTLAGHTSAVSGVATGVVDSCPIAVTGGADETVRVWDPATGRHVGEPLTGHTGWVRGMPTGWWRAVRSPSPAAGTGTGTGPCGTSWRWDERVEPRLNGGRAAPSPRRPTVQARTGRTSSVLCSAGR